jgi:hypothetical protein
MRTFVATFALTLWAGCTPSIPDGVYRCASSGDCPPGLNDCRGGLCYRPGGMDAPLDVPGLDVPGLDVPGLDAPLQDVPGLDAPDVPLDAFVPPLDVPLDTGTGCTPCPPDGDPCTIEVNCGSGCESRSGPDGVSCSDGLFCNGDEMCGGGVCQPGGARCVGELCDEGGDRCVNCGALGEVCCPGREVDNTSISLCCGADPGTVQQCCADSDCPASFCPGGGNMRWECVGGTCCYGVCDGVC